MTDLEQIGTGRLLEEIRDETRTAESVLWSLEGDEMHLVVEWPERTDRYLWNSHDGRYVHYVDSRADELRSA
jgi:hypothetical protein